ncbi:hypothetical protein BJX99DRAFT_219050 [Aspergillus californicus]
MADSKIVLVTGANTGIGFHIVRALYSADKPYTIILGARSLSNAENAINTIKAEFPASKNTITPLLIDLESDSSIESASNALTTQFTHLDALINNAGAQFDAEAVKGNLTQREMWNKSWNVNTTGTHILTTTLTPLLLKSTDPRLVFVTSGGSTLAGSVSRTIGLDNPPAAGWPKVGFGIGVPAYRSAKTGMNMMMREWARMLENDGVKVWAVSPGLLATGLGGDPELLKKIGAGDPVVVGPLFRGVLEGERDGEVGRVVSRAGVQDW